MEGAAVYFVCNEMNIPVIQIRAISNYIEPRNKSNWDIKKAIKSLEEFINIYKFI
jgi:futalosine hydrolase